MKYECNTNDALNEDADVVTFLCRYAITVWYFDADERARAKEKYLSGETRALSHSDLKYVTALMVILFMIIHFLNSVLCLLSLQ